MKKVFTFLLLLLGIVAAQGQTLPQFSSAGDTIYYYIQFQNGTTYLRDRGSGSTVQTAAKSVANSQKWAFFGTKNSFKLYCKTGRYLNFNGTYFTTNSTGINLKLVATTNSSYSGSWEIQRVDGDGKSMNQWGGTGTGRSLGEWTAGDSNNPVQFVEAQTVLPVFSTDDNEVYYFLKFAISGNVLADQGAGTKTLTATVDDVDGQKWKFIGKQDSLWLQSKAGNYATIVGTGNSARLQTTATKPTQTFQFVQTTNSTYNGYELHYNGTTATNSNLNQWSDIAVGQEIGLWRAGDQNNVFNYIKESNMEYADYKVDGATESGLSDPAHLALWYTQPATTTGVGNIWMEYSLPIGNGQLGGSLYGGVYKDQILINEKTLWSGKSTDNSSSYGAYQYFGSIIGQNISDEFSFSSEKKVKNYVRILDLESGVGSVKFSSPDETTNYERQYIASYPDNVVAARYTSDGDSKISMYFSFTPGVAATPAYSDGYMTMSGKLTTVSYNATMRVVPDGGTMTTDSEGIKVEGANSVLVLLAAGTDFDAYSSTYISNTSALATTMKSRVDAAAEKGWDALLASHKADYESYFGRCDLSLEGAENSLPTNKLIDAYQSDSKGTAGTSLMLEQLYFAYGRYLEIASSRGVDLPSNLQGIWNNSSTPPWNADIHSNINVQMNYWPAEPTNLSEMHMPYLNYITNMAMNHTEWQGYAKSSGQTKGWTLFTENNIFGGVGSFMHNYTIANAWYATHLWQHYRYTLDKDFLKSAFPTIWSACEFWLERMVKGTDGTYECPNEYSPEQGPSSENATAHAQQLVVELFQNAKDAVDILGDDAGLTSTEIATLEDYLENSDKGLATETYTGTWGSPCNGITTGTTILREWKTSSYTAGENGHRHQSHLMCLYPFAQVTPSSPYFQAAVNSLKLRSDNSTGWSMGWRINLWARAQDGDHAHTILHNALKHATSYSTNQNAGGIYYNLYDSHAPFQIDGNFGACAGIAEMLMQSATDTISILPALPSVWTAGSIKGMKAIGNFEVSITWAEGKATQVDIENLGGQPLVVKSADINEKTKYYVNGTETAVTATDDVVTIPSSKGDKVTISIDGSYDPTGIHNATKQSELQVSVSGRTVTLTGSDVSSVRVYDLQGHQVLRTAKRSFTVPESAGTAVILTIKGKQGQQNLKVGF